MRKTTPSVHFLGETNHDIVGIRGYLDELGVPDWDTCDVSSAERITEIMGRACYKAFGVDLNANLTKVREGNGNYLYNVIKSGHGSVFEHCTATFMFNNVSRVFTHELVRHRAGTAMSQESLRFVRLTDLGFWIPKQVLVEARGLVGDERVDKAIELIYKTVENLEAVQIELADLLGLNEEGIDFGYKKRVTSFNRRVAPIGLSTAIGFTMNHRAMRHIITMRTSRYAEEEIRLVFAQVAEIAKKRWPNIYADFKVEIVDGIGEYVPEFPKI